MNRVVGHIRDILIIALLTLTPAPILAGETVEIHGVLRETASGVILVTTATNYVVRGIDASGLGGCRAIVLGSREMDNGMDVIDAQEIKIAQ